MSAEHEYNQQPPIVIGARCMHVVVCARMRKESTSLTVIGIVFKHCLVDKVTRARGPSDILT